MKGENLINTVELKCPYDTEKKGRCYAPHNKKCDCPLRHHTASKTYSF